LWRHILQDQLAVTETEFWDCVDRKVTPTRAALPEPGAGLPADVVHQLMTKVGVPEAEVAQMTREQAIARLAEFWTTGH
jgi:hypothetical protein